MAGTKLGGKRAAETNKMKYGKDFYKMIGSLGGKTVTESTHKRGFAANREFASKMGVIGGRKSRRLAKDKQ